MESLTLTLFVNGTSFDVKPEDYLDDIIRRVVELEEKVKLDREVFKSMKKYLKGFSRSGDLDLKLRVEETDLMNGDEIFYKLDYPLSEILYSLEHIEDVKKRPFLIRKFTQTFILIEAVIDNSPNSISDIEQTREVCNFIYPKNKDLFKYFKNEFKSDEICEDYISIKHEELSEYINSKDCDRIEQYDCLIRHLDGKIIECMRCLPADHREKFIVIVAHFYKSLTERLPIENRTKSFYYSFVSRHCRDSFSRYVNKLDMLAFIEIIVPEEFVEYVIFLIDIDRCFFQEYLPDKYKTEEVCVKAVKNGVPIRYFPREQKTEKVCIEAVEKNGSSLLYIPDDLKTFDICMLSVKQDPKNRFLIPKKCMTKELEQAIEELLL